MPGYMYRYHNVKRKSLSKKENQAIDHTIRDLLKTLDKHFKGTKNEQSNKKM